MTFDKTWQLALLGSNRFSGNFAGVLDGPESRFTPRGFPVGGANRVGKEKHKALGPWINEQISEATFPVVSQSEHGLQISTHQNKRALCTA